MVVDTSAVLAILFRESSGTSIASLLADSPGVPVMSTVNYTEVLILVGDRRAGSEEEIRLRLDAMNIRIEAVSAEQAALAATARLRFPLNLGDCFAYALAKSTGLPLLTLDRDFRKTDLRLVSLR